MRELIPYNPRGEHVHRGGARRKHGKGVNPGSTSEAQDMLADEDLQLPEPDTQEEDLETVSQTQVYIILIVIGLQLICVYSLKHHLVQALQSSVLR